MNRMIMSREEQLHLAALINADRHEKLHALGLVIKGSGGLGITPRTKGASNVNNNNNDNNPRRHFFMVSVKKPDYLERYLKLKELGKMIKGSN
jgi:hypothetical protein